VHDTRSSEGWIKLSIQQRAAVWSVLAAAVSLAGAWLIAYALRTAVFAGPAGATQPDFEFVSTPQLVAEGAGFFGQSCGDCHGDDAHGDEGPDLHNIPISNARIASTIKNGVKGQMPSFAKKYHDPQISALVAYVRSLH
jgi:mono/diheme cytochrome c family protein